MRITAILLLAFVGCRSVEVESFDRQGEKHEPVAVADVTIFDDSSVIERPFRVIGAMQWNAKNPKTDEVNAALKEEAARIGADGIIKLRDEAAVSGPFFWPFTYVTGVAEAIRFDKK